MQSKNLSAKQRLKIYLEVLSQYKSKTTFSPFVCSNLWVTLEELTGETIRSHNIAKIYFPEFFAQKPKGIYTEAWWVLDDTASRMDALQKAIELTEKTINNNAKSRLRFRNFFKLLYSSIFRR